jgi:hypothetical protein
VACFSFANLTTWMREIFNVSFPSFAIIFVDFFFEKFIQTRLTSMQVDRAVLE